MMMAAMLLPLPAGAASTATPGATAAASAEVVLPSETCRGLFIVPVTVGEGEGKTLHLLLDTGSSWTFVDPGAMRRILGPQLRAGKVLFREARIGRHALGPLKTRVYPMG
ncbi:MAG: hypothetical protein V3U11_05555, partial [Planctomycetota bacterium]